MLNLTNWLTAYWDSEGAEFLRPIIRDYLVPAIGRPVVIVTPRAFLRRARKKQGIKCVLICTPLGPVKLLIWNTKYYTAAHPLCEMGAVPDEHLYHWIIADAEARFYDP